MSTVANSEPLIVDIEVTDELITAHLADGRTIRVPLVWSWRLAFLCAQNLVEMTTAAAYIETRCPQNTFRCVQGTSHVTNGDFATGFERPHDLSGRFFLIGSITDVMHGEAGYDHIEAGIVEGHGTRIDLLQRNAIFQPFDVGVFPEDSGGATK